MMPKWQGLPSVKAAHQLIGWEYPCVLSPRQDILSIQCSPEYTSSGQYPTTTTSHKDSQVPSKTIVSFFTCEAPGQPSGYSSQLQPATQLQAPPDQAQQQPKPKSEFSPTHILTPVPTLTQIPTQINFNSSPNLTSIQT